MSLAGSAPLYPTVPPSIELGAEARKQVIAGVKLALDRIKLHGLLPNTVEYAHLLGEPLLLRDFLDLCRSHASLLPEILRNAQGQPVTADDQALSCGPSPAQITQLLIYTVARRLFTDPEPVAAPPPSAAEKGGLFRRKAAPPPPPPPRPKNDGERKLELLKDHLAFSWQLPLLKYYYFALSSLQISELGADLLLLPNASVVEWVASFEAKTLRQVRILVGDAFPQMITANPYALRSLCIADRERLPAFQSILGPHVWDFYARDNDHVERVEKLDDEYLRILGRMLTTISTDAVVALTELPPERLRAFLNAYRSMLGDAMLGRMNDPAFSHNTLLPITQTFARLKIGDEEFVKVLDLKMEALRPALLHRIPD